MITGNDSADNEVQDSELFASVYDAYLRFQVPTIDPRFLQSVVYLYSNKQAAENSKSGGGTGFLVAIPYNHRDYVPQKCPYFADPEESLYHFYAVTNAHVVEGIPSENLRASPCIRINNLAKGTIDVFEFQSNQWTCDTKNDLAVIRVNHKLDPTKHDFRAIRVRMFLNDHERTLYHVGAGTDVFLLGRYVTAETPKTNTPTVRFGQIAQMTEVELRTSRQKQTSQDSVLIEVKSRSGYSGSPVFVYIGDGSPSNAIHYPYPDNFVPDGGSPWLLGIEWGIPQDYQWVRNKNGEIIRSNKSGENAMQVDTNPGMTAVIAVAKLEALLKTKDLTKERIQEEARECAERTPRASARPAGSGDDDEFTEEDFMHILRKASRPIQPPPPDPEESRTSE